MKKLYTTIVAVLAIVHLSFSQSQIITTGNNLIDVSNPKSADIVIGSDAGTRHDASIMWWSSSSASRISNTADVFYLSAWNTTNPNVGLAAYVGGTSYFKGSVGIGITTPSAPLTVQGGSVTTGLSNIATTLTTRFNTSNPPITLGIGYVSSDNPFLQAFNSVTSNANNLIINPFGGNVFIGKTTQTNTGYKLDVAGNIRSNQIVVNTTGADFVFEPDYKLSSLADLNTYIERNHHLPEILSAKEMQSNGLNVGDTEIKLLQKIEELTLYLIEKDKADNEKEAKLQSQQKQIEDQQKINQSLQEQIDKLAKKLNN